MKTYYLKTQKSPKANSLPSIAFKKFGIDKDKTYKLIYRNDKKPNKEVVYEISGKEFLLSVIQLRALEAFNTKEECYAMCKEYLMPTVEGWGKHYLKLPTLKCMKGVLKKYAKGNETAKNKVHDAIHLYMASRLYSEVAFSSNKTTMIVTDSIVSGIVNPLPSFRNYLSNQLGQSIQAQNKYLNQPLEVFVWDFPEDAQLENVA